MARSSSCSSSATSRVVVPPSRSSSSPRPLEFECRGDGGEAKRSCLAGIGVDLSSPRLLLPLHADEGGTTPAPPSTPSGSSSSKPSAYDSISACCFRRVALRFGVSRGGGSLRANGEKESRRTNGDADRDMLAKCETEPDKKSCNQTRGR